MREFNPTFLITRFVLISYNLKFGVCPPSRILIVLGESPRIIFIWCTTDVNDSVNEYKYWSIIVLREL